MNARSAVLVVLVLVVSSAVPVGGAVATNHQAGAYSGTHVAFETTSDAVVDYSVNGDTVFRSVKVQSQSTAEGQGDVRAGASLSGVTRIAGTGLSLEARTETSATVTAESGATMEAHDNSRGILVVRSGGESQYVTVDVDSAAQAESEGDQRVVVTTGDGTKGTFLVVGDGQVTVNEEGNVSAKLDNDGTLVFRSYPEGRNSQDKQQERLISSGTAAAEVYVIRKGQQGSELATDVVQYGEDTTVEVTRKTEGTVTMTAERSQRQGTVVITTVSERAISSVEDLEVTVDGEAAAEASSYSDLESAIGGDSSKFLVRQQSSAEANADVLVAVNHFSTREITMSEGGDGTASGGEEEATESDSPGFGPIVALLALAGVAALARVRRQ